MYEKLKNMTFEQRLEYMTNLSSVEWESICRGCGICCLNKYWRDDGGVDYARVACKNLDLGTRKCKCYASRLNGGECHNVDIDIVRDARVLPASCAYVEMLYGMADCPATVDWDTVVSEQDIGPLAAFRRIIPCSNHWIVKKEKR
jgi:uncharacterized cysteine cluster protein YcgN (CxxCxxCC family)